MDYKEKYEKALERARKLNADNMLSDEATEEIFPELKEDEDERIREDIIEHFQYEIEELSNKGEEYEAEIEELSKYVSYLEKQKEPRDYRKLYKGVSQSEWFKENYEGKSIGEEQKPVENSGKELLYVSNKSYNIGFRDGKREAEQKTAKWSEEDEKMYKCVLSLIHGTYVIETQETKDALLSWLKSLRPSRPSWKPSEVHLSALLAIISDPDNIGSQTCQLALTDLYEQLNKL